MANQYGTDNEETLVGTAGNDYIYGYAGDDTLSGGEGDDVLYGGEGNDTLFGGEGNDQLTGGEGADYMVGGNGNDTYFVENIGDEVIELTGGGVDTVVSFLANYKLDSNVENLTIGGTAAGNGSGNALGNSINGTNAANTLAGWGGNDSIYALGGNDIVSGGAGDDILDGGDGVDTVTFKIGATGGVSVDLSITAKQNTGQGIDKITNFENLEGTQFDDTLIGNNGVNKISALGGNDIIRGRGGDDDLTGGNGNDTFVFEAAAENGVDRIRGFTSGSDKLFFDTDFGYDAAAGFTVGTEAVGSGAQFVWDSVKFNLYYDADGAGGAAAVHVANLNPSALSSSDILIASSLPVAI